MLAHHSATTLSASLTRGHVVSDVATSLVRTGIQINTIIPLNRYPSYSTWQSLIPISVPVVKLRSPPIVAYSTALSLLSPRNFYSFSLQQFPSICLIYSLLTYLHYLRTYLFSIVGSPRGREVACSASDLQGLNFESCVCRAVSSHSCHHPQEVLLAQFRRYVHKNGLKPDSFHFSLIYPLTVVSR